MKLIRKSLWLKPEVWTQVKLEALERDLKPSQLIEQLLEEQLTSSRRKASNGRNISTHHGH